MNNDNLGGVETGNRPWIKAVITAPNVPGHTTDASTAITFNLSKPDATLATPVSSPNTDIVGPTAGTTTASDGTVLTTTSWWWKAPTIDQTGRYKVRWTSTAGVIAQDNADLFVPVYAPYATP